MEFAEAVRQCVDTMGAGVVRDSRRFVSCLLDYADDSLALRAAARNLDDGTLAPFVEALDAGDDADSLGLAAAKVEVALRNDRGLEASVAHGIASAIGDALAGVLAPPPKREADAQDVPTPQPEPAVKAEPSPVSPVSPVSPQPQEATSQPPNQAHMQSSVPAPKGRTFLGHGFWWWYGVWWVLTLLGYVVTALYGGSGAYLSIAGIDLSWFTVSPIFVNTAMTLWLIVVKLPVALYRHFRSKKT